MLATIVAALIGATATITAAVVQRNNAPTPNPGFRPTGAAALAAPSTLVAPSTLLPAPSSSTLSQSASSTSPATSGGVTYQCAGPAPTIAISYGPLESTHQATSLPFTAHDDGLQPTTEFYYLDAQLRGGGGRVTCTLTVTDSGRVTTTNGAAGGADNQVYLSICPDGDHYWKVCNL